MNNVYKINVTHQYNTSPNTIFKLMQNGFLFKLTGADGIEFEFREEGTFSLLFPKRGHIFGKFLKIIPNEKLILDWNVSGFNREDEQGTIVDISLIENTEGVSLIINHIEIKSELSAAAKKQAWEEILLELEKEIERISIYGPVRNE